MVMVVVDCVMLDRGRCYAGCSVYLTVLEIRRRRRMMMGGGWRALLLLFDVGYLWYLKWLN